MAYITKTILLPISDGADVSGLSHADILNSIAEHLRTVQAESIYDDFADNYIDTAKWLEVDSASNVNETGEKMAIAGNNNYNTNGVVSKTEFAKTSKNVQFFTVTIPSGCQFFGGLVASSLALSVSNPSMMQIYFHPNLNIYVQFNGASYDTGYNWIANKTYYVEIEYQNPGWKVRIQSEDDSNYTTITLIYQTVTDSTGSLYFQAQTYDTGVTCQVDDVGTKTYVSSVSPATVATSLDVGTIIKWSTARNVVYRDGVVQAETSTDWKCQKAVNDGAYNGTWLTMSHGTPSLGLKGQTNDTITTLTNSVKVQGQYNSSLQYEIKTYRGVFVDVDIPIGGGGIQYPPLNLRQRRLGL